MQEACIEKAMSPKSLVSRSLISSVEQVKTFNQFYVTLTKGAQWNFLDIRMMEAMVSASRVPAAQQSLENFKKGFLVRSLMK